MKSGPFAASRAAAVASTSKGSACIARATALNRAITSSAWATPSGFSIPVCSSPLPRRSTAFSLKIATGRRPVLS